MGEDTKLSPEQWAMVRTSAFKAWFGDWEKVSTFKSGIEKPGKKETRFRSDTLGQDVILPLGNAGAYKDASNPNSDVKGAHGFVHMMSMRMAHGESMHEAAYTACKAVMAVVNGEIANVKQRGKTLSLDGYNGVIKADWQDSKNAWVITGYKKNGEKSSADDRRKAMNLAADYALDSFGGLKEVGAALDYAIARLTREYKQNCESAQEGVEKVWRWRELFYDG